MHVAPNPCYHSGCPSFVHPICYSFASGKLVSASGAECAGCYQKTCVRAKSSPRRAPRRRTPAFGRAAICRVLQTRAPRAGAPSIVCLHPKPKQDVAGPTTDNEGESDEDDDVSRDKDKSNDNEASDSKESESEVEEDEEDDVRARCLEFGSDEDEASKSEEEEYSDDE